MRTRSNFLLLSTLFGGLLFTCLFWMERLAINLLIYSVFIIAISFFNSEIIKSKKFIIYAIANLFAAVLVVINNSDLTLATYYISLILFVGFAHYQTIRNIFSAGLASLLQIMAVPASILRHLYQFKVGRFNLKPIFKLTKYILLPIIIVVIFASIYSSANEVFAHYLISISHSISLFISRIFSFIFQDLSIARFLHICLGILISGGLIITFYNRSIEKLESNCTEDLIRNRRDKDRKSLWFEIANTFTSTIVSKNMALKTEYVIGVISFIALNILLLMVNFIDISTLWFGYKPSGNFSADLHNGTNSLIFSILLAMAVILYFFRKNLNFYSKSKTLRFLAYAWIIQNLILIISVFIRDGYYIEFYGLTHKRIGVSVFALLCIIGLATVYFKVGKQKTLFYLFKVNGNIWFALLLIFSTINWDVFIAKYNLAHRDKISLDVDYLLSLSDKTLVVLDENRQILHFTEGTDLADRTYAMPENLSYYQNQLDQRIGFFKERYKEVSWLSWNLQDWRVATHFGFNKR
ncbi:DUF4173 domain-containing protein [Pedobacter changchengzhani]|uniref:DUF4173 domain-containing protein n=1 Tax=Pedobacter changchengzhani TaxID=2529274 RepID=A0A4R5MLR5_9SPHI|nr:DUF4173 domain-containing protein [Pedobacter changchengzhani]TDG36572.1 DUF4173 domain-containing protein [Pedobacter changchengzhani]